MRSKVKNISVVLLVSVILSGCQSLQLRGYSTNGGLLGSRISAEERTDTEIMTAKKQFRESNYGLAEKNFRALVELNPTNGEAWLGLAASYDQLGLFNRSDRAYEQVIKLVGPNPAILNNQGYSQLLRGNKKAARRLFKKAERMEPDNARILGNLELLRKV